MSNILEGLVKLIRTAKEGIDVRDSIADGIEEVGKKVDNISNISDEISESLEDIRLGSFNTITGFYKPPTIPECNLGTNNIPKDYKEPNKHLEAILSEVLKNNSEYIKQIFLGKDQSGQYDIFKYELTPKNYVKTIMLVGGVHGNEYTAMYGVCHFLRLLADTNEKSPILNYIRENVRVVAIPLVNPWGFANSIRQNSRGVDLNRNHDYLWENYNTQLSSSGKPNYKGTAPYSEKETQYIKQVVESISDDLVGYLDCHNIVSVDAEHIYYAPRHHTQRNDLIASVIHHLNKNGDRVIWGTGKSPTSYSYVSDRYNVTAGTPEWRDGLHGNPMSSVEMTKIVEWFSNLAIKLASIETNSTSNFIDDSFGKVLTYQYKKGNSKLYLTQGSDYVSVKNTVYSMDIKRHGIARVDGYVKINLSEEATVSIIPCLYQNYQVGLNFQSTKDSKIFERTIKLPAGSHIIPLHSMIYVFPTCHITETITRCEKLKFRLRGKVNAGTCYVEALSVSIQYIPSNKGISVEILDGTNRENVEEENNFIRLFPADEYGGEAEID